MTTLTQDVQSIASLNAAMYDLVRHNSLCSTMAAFERACSNKVTDHKNGLDTQGRNRWNRIANLADSLATRLVRGEDTIIADARVSSGKQKVVIANAIDQHGPSCVADAIRYGVQRVRDAWIDDLSEGVKVKEMKAEIKQLTREDRLLDTFVRRITMIDIGR